MSRLKKGWLTILLLLILAGCGFLFITEGVPRLAGLWIKATLHERRIEAGDLAVERVGPTETRFSPGSLKVRGQEFSWRSVEVHYSPADLLSGRAGELLLVHPRLTLQWPVHRIPEPEQPVVIRAGEESLPAEPTRNDGKTAAGPEAVPPRKPVARQSVFLPDPGLSFVPGYANLLGFFEALPLRQLSTREGDFGLELFDQPELSGKWEAFLLNGSELLSGRVFLDAGPGSLYTTINGVKSAGAVSVQGDLLLQPELLSGFAQRLSRGEAKWLGTVDLKEDLACEVLLDWVGPGQPTISAEGRLGAFDWKPGDNVALTIKSLMVLGTFDEGMMRLNAGCRIGEITLGKAVLSPFGVRASFTSGQRIRVESERFTLSAPGWSGHFAIRGSALPPSGMGIPDGQLELAFSHFAGPAFSVEPASFLLRSGEMLSFQSSPLGFKRKTTLWVEKLQLEADHELSRYSGSFTWYNAAGAHMGDIFIINNGRPGEKMNATFLLNDKSGNPFLDGTLRTEGRSVDLAAKGELSFSWLNAFNDWADWLPVRFTGASAKVDLSLAGLGRFPRGQLSLSFPDSGFTLRQGLVVEGLTGEIPLQVLGLPRTRGEQNWSIRAATSGSLVMRDIRLRWSLPTIRSLRIHELSGRLGGGMVSTDPFSVDPLDPQPAINVRFSRLDASRFLDWYGEERFAIEGTLSGTLGLQWREGVWLVGQSSLRIDNSTTGNRIVFSDKTFLREQFVNLTGVPEELKQPLLSALLEKGIRIDNLELQLEAVPGKEEISLKLTLSGETVTEEIEVPIESLVINNLVSKDDLARLLGLVGPVRFLETR